MNLQVFAAQSPGRSALAEPPVIQLRVKHCSNPLEFKLEQPIIIGREFDEESQYVLDLTSMGGVDNGVSRRHARLVAQGNAIFLVDMGSLNGTMVNAKKLNPYEPCRLQDGDYVHLGILLMQVLIP